ncbi:unnamed protein product [Euphydryas editha]|uniref:Protein NRDE2 homolog n=1 Tax=Euphydryas editha TaxID=104508 RepID=A0AAU9VGY3_EUPED|nr:unnamed protein product [Euphydryas editha]
MALFPAYSSQEEQNIAEEPVSAGSVKVVPEDFQTDSTESQLLASDTEDDKAIENSSKPAPSFSLQVQSNDDFYVDRKLDRGNLRVSTLYYPGRPQYECGRVRLAGESSAGGRARRSRRYYSRRAADEPDEPAVAARAAAYRQLLARAPHDVALWERYIDFQEVCGDAETTLTAAEEAAARVPRSGRLRARALAALRAARPLHVCLERLRGLLAAGERPLLSPVPHEPESARAVLLTVFLDGNGVLCKEVGKKCGNVRLELWERLLGALGASPDCDAAQLTRAAAAALADTRGVPHAYPRLFYCVGSYLRAAGLWERLVLSIELVVAMNYAPASFPPPALAELAERAERRLRDLEDKVADSGLPLGARWVRVERARAAAHWRPAPRGAPLDTPLDPQRSPLAPDVADLLLPASAPGEPLHLAVRLLQLAKVPLLPATQWARRVGGAPEGGEALLPLLLAVHALPPAHPARVPPALAPRLLTLLLDPPHYFSDDTGYLSWVNALWDACCEWASGWARAALLCWRLRWLHALLLAAGGGPGAAAGGGPEAAAGGGSGTAAEAVRLRGEARALLRRFDCASPLPFAELARLELLAAGRGAALRVAARALRAALLDPACPPHHVLHVARVVCEVSAPSDGAALSAEGACALVCAALGRAPPADLAAPAASDLAAALETCERRCGAAEGELAAGGGDEGVAEALLPGVAEWARARALLAPPPRRAELLAAALAAARDATAAERADASRYYEESACALTAAAAREGRAALTARLLAPLFPDNAYLALAGAGAPLWARDACSQEQRVRALAARGACHALAALLPALLAALAADFAPAGGGARGASADEGRGGGAAGGATLWSARLELEARAPAPRLPAALYAALDAAPEHKWLYVRGAAWCGGEARALADALLERALRLHALPDELRAADDNIPPATYTVPFISHHPPPDPAPPSSSPHHALQKNIKNCVCQLRRTTGVYSLSTIV